MAKQTMSLRLEQDDLSFLASLDQSGSGTLSDKIRGLIDEARIYRQGMERHDAAYDYSRNLLAPVDRRITSAEMHTGKRSELIHRALSTLPELLAFTLSACPDKKESAECEQRLAEIERGLAQRLMSLVSAITELQNAGFAGCIDPIALKSLVHPTHSPTTIDQSEGNNHD